MKDTYGKPVYEICVDKTSCRHETSLDKDRGEPKPRPELPGQMNENEDKQRNFPQPQA